MALFLVRKVNPYGSVDILLVSSISKEIVEKTMQALYGDCKCEVPEEDPTLVEQLFNEQYGGIAVLQTV